MSTSFSYPVRAVYRVLLQPGKTLRRDLFPPDSVILLENTSPTTVRLTVAGAGADIERVLRSLKELIVSYERT
jgi:hypothetical protein